MWPVSGAPTSPQAEGAPVLRRLRTDVFMMVATKGLALVLGVVLSVVLARGLGPSGRGTLAAAFNMTLLLIQLGVLGVTTANPYFVARDPAAVARLAWNSLWGALTIGAALAGAGFAVLAIAPSALAGVSWAQAALAFSAIPSSLASQFLQSILLGQGRTVAYNAVEAFAGIGAVVALVLGFTVFDLGVAGALGVLAAQQLGAAVAFAVLLAPHLRRWRWPDLGLARSMMGYGFRIYVAALLAYMLIRVDMLLVNGMLGADEAGRYAVAVALADGLVLIPAVVGLNLFTRVAHGGTTETTAEVFRAVGLLFGLLCLASVPLAGVGIRLLYGEPFADATSLYLWLLPGIYCLGMLTILSHHFAGRGFPLAAMLVWFAGLGLNLAINLLFLRAHGTAVAAIASSVAYAVLYGLHVSMFARETGGLAALRPRIGEAARMVRTALSRTPAAP
jgi:O-antigen/teichoic acid export membrane protein